MAHHKQHSGPASSRQVNRDRTGKGSSISTEAIGGREFGQVIEPMQAEMASENEGLTDSSHQKSDQTQMKISSKKKRRKAA
jgi:hypothetical protein